MVAVGNERCAHKARADVVQTDMPQMPDGTQLLQTFHVVTHIALGSRVSRRRSKPLSACNAADHGNVARLLTLGKVGECSIYHARESQRISFYGAQFLVGLKLGILITDARTVEVEVDAVHPVNELQQLAGCIVVSDVNTRPCHHPTGLGLNAFQHIFAAAGNAHLPPLAAQLAHHLEPYARCGTHHHGTTAISFVFHINII